ncbi:MAG: hypothetical protein WBM92_05455 [Aureibaculum sp.]
MFIPGSNVTVIDPSEPPLQETSSLAHVKTTAGGTSNVMLILASHPVATAS